MRYISNIFFVEFAVLLVADEVLVVDELALAGEADGEALLLGLDLLPEVQQVGQLVVLVVEHLLFLQLVLRFVQVVLLRLEVLPGVHF